MPSLLHHRMHGTGGNYGSTNSLIRSFSRFRRFRAFSFLASRRLRSHQRMPAPLIELVLQPQAFIVGLDGLDRLHDRVDPGLGLELAELARRDRTFAGVVVREA